MRNTFFTSLMQLAANDPMLYLIVGDVGFSVAEPFQQTYPQRFINAGIAEQNMIGVAAGLAMAGKNVYVYSIVPFVTMRCFEQIRNDLCYQKLPVKLVGVGGGFSYGPMGVTHHALEDVAIMRALPHMTVVSPGSKYETEQLVPQINALTGPAYLRLAANEELVTYQSGTKMTLGKACEIIPHKDQYLVASGNALDLAMQVNTLLKKENIDIGLVSMPTIKPLDHEFFANRRHSAIFTIEEHSCIGGLGDAVARLLCETSATHSVFHAFGVNDCYPAYAGSRTALKEQLGLTPQHIAEIIMNKISYSKDCACTASSDPVKSSF